MLIRIPSWLVRLSDGFCDFGSVVLYTGGRFGDLVPKIMVIDVLIVIAGVGFGGYYWLTSGWQAALQTEALYVFGFAVVMWFVPRGNSP